MAESNGPVVFDNFSGIRPAKSDLRLAINEAITASNVELRQEFLAPRIVQRRWYDSDPAIYIAPLDVPETIFCFRKRDAGDYWMYWETDVDVAAGPVDSYDQRHYYTGESEPRMFTADSIDDTTPPYPQAADTKYPYTWYYLGVPAPTTAPVIDEGALVAPSEGSTGIIESVTAANLLLRVNAHQSNTSGYDSRYCDREGRNAGLNTANIRTYSGTGVNITCLKLGSRFRVTSIVDADHVEVVAAGRADGSPAEDLGYELAREWRWDNALPDSSPYDGLEKEGYDSKRRTFFMLPDTVEIEVANHVLRVGDVIRITGASEDMTWTTASTLTTSPVPTAEFEPGNVGFRTLSKIDATPIVFSGAVGFLIERDGEEIDPAVPATAAYEISTRSYVYTYVTALGEESAPSPASPVYTVRDGDAVPITTFAAPPTAHRNIDRIWIYRTNTASDGTVAYQYVDELPVANIASGYIDTTLDEDLDEALETEGWDEPRSDMRGIVALPNGMLAGFVANRLCFSVPGQPHAWPRDYEQLVDYDIVGLEVFGNSVFVVTTGKPYIATGTHPAQMSLRRVEQLVGGLSKQSIVGDGQRVLYCSGEGLISGGHDGTFNLTANHFDKKQWREIVGPDGAERSLRAWYYDGQYILQAYYVIGEAEFSNRLVFDMRGDELRVSSFSEEITAGYFDPQTAELYYTIGSPSSIQLLSALPNTGGETPVDYTPILRWAYESPYGAPSEEYSPAVSVWASGTVMMSRPTAFSVARVICRRVEEANGNIAEPASLTLYVYGRQYSHWNSATTPTEYGDEITLVNGAVLIDGQPGAGGWVGEQQSMPFRIQANTLVDAVRIELEFSGPLEIERVILAEQMSDVM